MSPVLRWSDVLPGLLLCALLVAPLSAEAQSRKGGRGAASKRKATPEVTKPSTIKPSTTAPDLTSDSSASSSSTPAQSGGAPSRGPTRIDFDDRLIQGQTNKSGAVYLYDRKELKQRSMVKVPEGFREEIVQTVYDR